QLEAILGVRTHVCPCPCWLTSKLGITEGVANASRKPESRWYIMEHVNGALRYAQMSRLEDAIQDALTRPVAERLILVERLMESLDDGLAPGIREAWDALLTDRLTAFETGGVATEDWSEVQQRVAER